jgi:hypothetical protein
MLFIETAVPPAAGADDVELFFEELPQPASSAAARSTTSGRSTKRSLQ